MKRGRRNSKSWKAPSKKAASEWKQALQTKTDALVVAHYLDAVRQLQVGWCTRVSFAPRNLSTEHIYSGVNVSILRETGHSADPFFLTFKQAQKLGFSVSKGSKAVAHIKLMRSKEYTRNDGTKDELVYADWSPVFHCSQLDEHASLPGLVKNLQQSINAWMAPAWLTRLNELYEKRKALPAENVMALEESAVPSLMQLASRTVLVNQHRYTTAEIAERVSHDVQPFLWPIRGIDAVDAYISKTFAAEKVTQHDATFPRAQFNTPAAYYSHLFVCCEPEGWSGLLRALRHAEQCHIAFVAPTKVHDLLYTFRALDAVQQEAVIMKAVVGL